MAFPHIVEVSEWTWASPEQVITAVEVFTDGSSFLTQNWPRTPARGGWAVVATARIAGGSSLFLGATCGPVVTQEEERGHLGATVPSAPAAELSAILVALFRLSFLPHPIPITVCSDCLIMLKAIQGLVRLTTHAEPLRVTRRFHQE